MDAYDLIIVGTGAGGGTLARHLAPSGKRILLLERGDWLPREPQNWDTADVFVDNRYVSPDRWYDRDGKPFELEATGLLAVAIQHENDHLDGVLMVDHMGMLKRRMVQRKLQKKAVEATR